MTNRLCTVVRFPIVLLPFLVSVSSARAGEPAPAPRTVLLETQSPWRCHLTWLPPVVRAASGELEIIRERTVSLRGQTGQFPVFTSAPPPAEWSSAEFDDALWPSMPGPLAMPRFSPYGEQPFYHAMGLMCLRGRFRIDDPAKTGNLSLSLSYRGGVVVYVNGRELVRGHMPEGELRPDTPAHDYPPEAYVNVAGQRILADPGAAADDEARRRFELRVRHLRDVPVPAAMLRKGVNVLAVELHRAPRDLERYGAAWPHGQRGAWSMLGFESLELSAAPGSVAASVVRPAGIRVFNPSPLIELHDMDFPNPNDPLRPLVLASTRNGSVSGCVALSSTVPVEDLKVSVSDIASAAGGRIAASAVLIRYGLPIGIPNWFIRGHYPHGAPRHARPRALKRFDALDDVPPETLTPAPGEGGLNLPIWLTVCVPADAAPGEYTGTLAISARGLEPVAVPVRLSVAGFALPAPADFESFVGFIQSPDTLAVRYGVALWSERHWALIERSLELLGQIGNDCIVIPLVCDTHYGNKESMVRWVAEPEGTYRRDLSVAERYLDLARKHLGRVGVVCLCVWEPVNAYSSAGEGGRGLQLDVSVLDPKTGAVGRMPVPQWGSEASRAFWKPVFDEMAKLLEAKALATAMCVGTAAQQHPGKDVLADIEAVAPGIRWYSVAHPYVDKVGGKQTAFTAQVYGQPGDLSWVPLRRYYGWKNPHVAAFFPRGAFSLKDLNPLMDYHFANELIVCWGLRGLGHIGADFWYVQPPGEKPGAGFRRITRGNWVQLSLGDRGVGAILAPGRNGPVATARFEAFREGLQETEARIFIEKALTNPELKNALGEELAARAQKELDDRCLAIEYSRHSEEGRIWYAQTALERTRRLYALAAEVAARLPRQHKD